LVNILDDAKSREDIAAAELEICPRWGASKEFISAEVVYSH
jgi:hypothetical protein